MSELMIDNLLVKVFDTRKTMGKCAAKDVQVRLIKLLREKEEVNMIFASAPSQNEFLEALTEAEGVDWNRVNAFHMDEYIGLSQDHPQRFSNFLKQKLFDKLSFKTIYLLNPDTNAPERSCAEYAALLRKFPADIVCMGIGENNHIAFNDPHVANFEDPEWVKTIHLDDISRYQQVHDGCFSTIDEVPEMAVTLTIPALMSAGFVYCIVPGSNKANAIYRTMNDEINEKYPSTILRRHDNAILYIDEGSALRLDSERMTVL